MTKQPSMVGLSIGHYQLDELLSDGPFSWVFGGTHPGGFRKAFKVARPCRARDYRLRESFDPWFSGNYPTLALFFGSEGTHGADPDPAELLRCQWEKLRVCSDPALVAAEAFLDGEIFPCLQMEYIQGRTLRAHMGQDWGERNLPLRVFSQLARALDRLSQHPAFGHHGDLKPENIMVTAEGAKILDPAFFGDISCLERSHEHVMVTTPAYYPWLDPRGDLGAVCLMLWEAVCRRHPLKDVMRDLTSAHGVIQRAGQGELNSFMMAFPSNLHPTSYYRSVVPELDGVLQRALAVFGPPEGPVKAFSSFSELAEALEELERKGIDRV